MAHWISRDGVIPVAGPAGSTSARRDERTADKGGVENLGWDVA